MYKYFLALGSNLGNRQRNIDISISKIQQKECKIINIAPLFETEALTLPNADASYNKMFYNTAIEISTKLPPLKLLFTLQQIEYEVGRPKIHEKWAPRVIDIDILYCEKDSVCIYTGDDVLTIPHKEIFNRAFVLDPLAQIAPYLTINGKNVLTESKKHNQHQAIKMAIINVNNNSFSGDGTIKPEDIENKIAKLVKERVGFIDIGAESTNPHASPISWQEEIKRLQNGKVFDLVKKYKTNGVKFSIDTYHPETAKIAIEYGFDVINDVNGFKNERMWNILKANQDTEAVIMNSIIPNGNKQINIGIHNNVIELLNQWVKSIKDKALNNNVNQSRIIIDYGIGFGKTAEQDLNIINNFENINDCGFRTLIGFSRKSFLTLLNATTIEDKDKIGKQLYNLLQQKGAGIIRMHLS